MKTSVNNNNIESKNATRKAASKNTRKALCDELCALLGYKTWKIKTQAGSRDWAGIYDYSLVFDDGKELFISTSSRKDLFDIQVRELIDGFKRTSKEGIKPGDWVKTNSGRVAKVVRVSKEWEDHCAMLYLKESGVAPRNDGYVEIHNLICAADEVTIITDEDLKPATDVKDDYKQGDRVRHNQSGREATVTDIRVTKEMKAFGELRKVYRLDFGETVLGPFGYDLNGGEFIAEAITELLPEPPKEIIIEDATLQEASEIKEADFSDTLADDLKAGDRVLSRHYGAQATVLGREWDKQRKAWYYRVKFDTMQRHMDGSEFNMTEFHRDGLTKNYDPATGRERVGNAEYYRETLLAEFWGNDRTPRTVYGMEIFKPTDRRPSWLVVADIFSEPKEMTLREVCDMLAARYQDEQGEAA